MTSLEVAYRYGAPPGEREMRAINVIREIYGLRRMQWDEKEHTIRIEYDASRLNEDTISSLLRRAGLDLREKLDLIRREN
jgi:hypothetical protein